MKTEKLKEATRELHQQVEAENLARFIMDHTIDMKTYRLLLLQNYLAYKNTETAIAGYIKGYVGTKHHELAKDLKNLEVPQAEINSGFSCNSVAEAFGAAYVVEGSALGGMVLAKNIPHCSKLSSIQTHHFFNGDRDNLEAWKNFKTRLAEQNFSEKEQLQATEKAKETFRFFREVFRMEHDSLQS